MERENTEVRFTQKEEILTEKVTRSPDERHTQTRRTFTVKTAPRRVFIYIFSLLIEKDICDCRNVSVKLPCVYVCLSSGDLFVFSARVSLSFPIYVRLKIVYKSIK